jgi:hypothetical protein
MPDAALFAVSDIKNIETNMVLRKVIYDKSANPVVSLSKDKI